MKFSDHGKLALAVVGLGIICVLAWTRSLSREEIMFFIAGATVEGFLIRSIVVK